MTKQTGSARKAKFKVGQRVWCRVCAEPVKILGKKGVGFATTCLQKPDAGDAVLPEELCTIAQYRKEVREAGR
jgi:hypothetical protein